MNTRTFVGAVRKFKAANAGWLKDTHLPLVISLEAAARRLDAGDDKVTLLQAYNQTYSRLLALAPRDDAVEEDDLTPIED